MRRHRRAGAGPGNPRRAAPNSSCGSTSSSAAAAADTRLALPGDLDVLVGAQVVVLWDRAFDLLSLVGDLRPEAVDERLPLDRNDQVVVEQLRLDLFNQLLALRDI